MYKVSAESIHENHQRVTYLRIIVLFCLAAIAGGGGFLVFYLLNQMEEEICVLQFDSVADLIQASIISNFESKVKISQYWSKEFGLRCPKSETWPNCHYDLEVFDYILGKGPNARVLGFAPFVSPENIQEFEAFSKTLFTTTPRYLPETGNSSFGFGIFGIDNSLSSSDHRYHDTTGLTSYGSPYHTTVPVLLLNDVVANIEGILYNLHSEPSRGHAIDHILHCNNQSYGSNQSHPCQQSSMTQIIQSILDSKQIRTTAIYSPIYPQYNQTDMVGISFTYVYWDQVMNISVSSSFPEIVVVVQSNTSEISYSSTTSSISYSYKQGQVINLGDGDQHTSTDSNMKQSKLFTSNSVDPTSAQYSFVIYPAPTFCDYYRSSGPTLVLVGLLCMMAITAILFGMYDYFMKSESLLRKFLLESKRLFVRFISHELRTPLTAVSLGLSLVESDLDALLAHPSSVSAMPSEFMKELKQCRQSLGDISENTVIAIEVLNDMLQYDKIESQSLQCECVETNIWEIIRGACGDLLLQAKASHLTLAMNLQIDLDESDESWKVNPPGTLARLKSSVVVGDPIKLSQVVRNLISNALKFSPPGSEVKVNGEIPSSISSLTTLR
jgi:hypothetical protein